IVAAVFQLPDRILVVEVQALLLGQGQGKTQASRVEPARAQGRQARTQVGSVQGAGQAVDRPVVGPFDETVALLGHANLPGARLPFDPFVPIDNDLGAPGGIATQAHDHVAPLRVEDLKVIVLDIGPLLGPTQRGDLALTVAPYLPQRGRGASDQHGEDPTKGWVLGPMLARDLIFEVARATFHPENTVLLAMRLEPPGQVPGGLPQRLAAQTRIIALPLAPKGAEAPSGLPQW